MPGPYDGLRESLDNPDNWKMAAVPKPDKAFGATAPFLAALRDLYKGSDISTGLTDFARRAYNHTPARYAIEAMEQAGQGAGPGRYIKDVKNHLQHLRQSGQQGYDVAEEITNQAIDSLFPVFFGK